MQEWWDNIKQTNMCIMWISEGTETVKGQERLRKEIHKAENFPNMRKDMNI